MRKNKLSRLYWTVIFGLYAYGVRGVSLCTKMSKKLGLPEFDTLCDLDFCTCRDPFGRIRCICPNNEPDEEIIVKSTGPCSVSPDTAFLSIENCARVTVIKDAFQGLRGLQNFELVNVGEVDFQGRIFPSNGPPHNVQIRNSTVPDMPSFTFSGNINSIVLDNCSVGVIRAFAFSSIDGADRIMFRDTKVASVEAQSFKKFTINKFLIVNSHFPVIPSRFVVDVSVEAVFKIESTYIDTIRTSGFRINNPKKVLVINSMINKLHEESFKMITKGEVVIESNVFNSIDNEAFRGVTVDKYVIQQSGKQKFKFQNQTITNLDEKSLYINRTVFDVQIERVKIDEVCSCDALVLWSQIIAIGTQQRPDSFETDLEQIWCHMDDARDGEMEFVSGLEFHQDQCTKLTTSIYFFVLIIAVTAVGLVVIVSIIVCCMLRRRKKWKPVPSGPERRTSQKKPDDRRQAKVKNGGGKSQSTEGKSGTTKAIIVPDGRTYKETEFHIIVEKAEPLTEECVSYKVVRDRSRSQIS